MTDSHTPIVTTTDDDEITVIIAGEFDMPATFTAEPALEEAMERPGLRSFTLDLTGLTFIDSLGLGVVIRLAAELEARGIPMRILPGPPPVQRVFTSAGLTQALPFEPDASTGATNGSTSSSPQT
jgi:anti-sigma B factor antagonist